MTIIPLGTITPGALQPTVSVEPHDTSTASNRLEEIALETPAPGPSLRSSTSGARSPPRNKAMQKRLGSSEGGQDHVHLALSAAANFVERNLAPTKLQLATCFFLSNHHRPGKGNPLDEAQISAKRPDCSQKITSGGCSTGSRERPLEVNDSEDDAPGTPIPSRNMRSRRNKEHASMGNLEIIELTDSETEIARPAIPRRARERVREVPASTATNEEELENRPRKLPRLSGPPRPKSESLESGKAGNMRLDDISLSHFEKHIPKTAGLAHIAFKDVKEEEQAGEGSTIDQQQLDLKPAACEVKAELLPQSLDELRLALSKLSNPKAEVKEERRLDADTVLNLLPHDALRPYDISLPEE
ncbi:hypothetical protein ACG7TL_003359 [Trametes sanguinea]